MDQRHIETKDNIDPHMIVVFEDYQKLLQFQSLVNNKSHIIYINKRDLECPN